MIGAVGSAVVIGGVARGVTGVLSHVTGVSCGVSMSGSLGPFV